MHGRPTVVRMVGVDWNPTLETVVERRGKSNEPSMKQVFGFIMVGGACTTSTLKAIPFVCVVPETW